MQYIGEEGVLRTYVPLLSLLSHAHQEAAGNSAYHRRQELTVQHLWRTKYSNPE